MPGAESSFDSRYQAHHTLNETDITFPKHQSSPSVDAEREFGIAGATPLPHLPLKKQASRKLRLGWSRSQKAKVNPLKLNGAEKDVPPALPASARSVADSVMSTATFGSRARTDSDANSIQISPPTSRQTSVTRPRAKSNASSTTSYSVRPSISTPDFNFAFGDRSTSSTDETPPTSITTDSIKNIPSPPERVDSGKSEELQSARPSHDKGDMPSERSSGVSLRDSNSSSYSWRKRKTDSFSVEDCIMLYVNGFEDDPPEVPSIDFDFDDQVKDDIKDDIKEEDKKDIQEDAEESFEERLSDGIRDEDLDFNIDNEEKVVEIEPPAVEILKPVLSVSSAPTLTEQPKSPDTDLLSPSSSTAFSEPLPGILKPFAKQSVRTSAQIISGQNLPESPDPSPPSTPLTASAPSLRDRYGFKKETQWVSLVTYEKWSKDYDVYLKRRRMKWKHLMNEAGCRSDKTPTIFPPKSEKVKRFIRKGIPPDWRGNAWWFYAGGPAAIAANPGLYQSLIARASRGEISDSDKEHIERDLHRTFPDNDRFKPDPSNLLATSELSSPTSIRSSEYNSASPETHMIKSLRRVLQAFAIHNSSIGYCQSMNFLAGHLLLFLQGDEERAFHLLSILLKEHLPGTHGIALEGANVDIGVLMTAIKEAMPALFAKLDDRSDGAGAISTADLRDTKNGNGLPTVSLATTSWFMSCFVSVFPTETTCRVWDCLFYEGTKTLFRVALGVFWLGETQIRQCKDGMDAFQIVQTLPRSLVDANMVIDAALKTKGLLGEDAVQRLREERRGIYQRQLNGSIPVPATPTDDGPSGGLERGRSKKDTDPDHRPLSRGLSRATSRARMRRMKSMGSKKG